MRRARPLLDRAGVPTIWAWIGERWDSYSAPSLSVCAAVTRRRSTACRFVGACRCSLAAHPAEPSGERVYVVKYSKRARRRRRRRNLDLGARAVSRIDEPDRGINQNLDAIEHVLARNASRRERCDQRFEPLIGQLLQAELVGQQIAGGRSEEHTSELQSPYDIVCRLLLEKKKNHKLYFFVISKKKYYYNISYSQFHI